MPAIAYLSKELLSSRILQRLSARFRPEIDEKKCKSMLVLFLLVAVYSILMSYFAIERYHSFQAGFYDLGIFNHDFWVRIFDFERISGLQCLIFGGHVAPSLYLLLPFYSIHPGCETLIILQTIILALAAIPLYFIASEALSSNRLGIVSSAAYLLYSPLHWVNRADFHAQAFIPVLFLSAFYFYRKNNFLCALFLVLTAFTIEFAPLVVIFFGIYALTKEILSLRKGKCGYAIPRLPVITILVGAMFLISQFVLVSSLQASYPPLHCQELFGFERALPLQVVKSGPGSGISFDVLLKPMIIIGLVEIDFASKLGYMLLMFGFAGFMPLLAPLSVLLAAPWLAIILLTSYPPYYSTTAHYSAQIIGQVFLSAVLGVKALSRIMPRLSHTLPWALLALVLVTAVGDSPLSPMNSHTGNPHDPLSSRWWPQTTQRDLRVEEILQNIPSNASVLATNELASHLSSRAAISVFRLDIPYPDFVAVDAKSASFSRLEESYFWSLEDLLEEANYLLRSSYDGVKIFERDKSAPVIETATILPIDQTGQRISKVSVGSEVFFSGKATSPKGEPVGNGRVHMFASIDGRWVARSSTVLEWNSEPTDAQGVYDTRRSGEPIPANGPEWLEIKPDGVYINGHIKAWLGDPRGKTMRAFAVVWGSPYQYDLSPSIEIEIS